MVEQIDDLDTMSDPTSYLDDGEIEDWEEGFMHGYAAA